MRHLRAAAALVVLASLEISLAGKLSIRGISPDLLACFAAYVALQMRPSGAVVWAWGAGLASDLFFGFKLGPFAICYGIAAYVLAGAKNSPFRGGHTLNAVATFALTAAAHTGFWLMHCVFAAWSAPRVEMVGLLEGVGTSLAVGVYSAAVSPLVFEVLGWAVGRDHEEPVIGEAVAVSLREGGVA